MSNTKEAIDKYFENEMREVIIPTPSELEEALFYRTQEPDIMNFIYAGMFKEPIDLELVDTKEDQDYYESKRLMWVNHVLELVKEESLKLAAKSRMGSSVKNKDYLVEYVYSTLDRQLGGITEETAPQYFQAVINNANTIRLVG